MDQFDQISPVTGPMRGEIDLSQVLKLVSQFVQQYPWQIRQVLASFFYKSRD